MMRGRARVLAAAATLVASSVPSILLRAQSDLDVLPAQGSVFVLATAGGNTTVQIGPDGPLVVDTQPAALSDRVLAAIRGLTPRPIRHIVLTSGDDQNAGGAANLAKAGRYVRVIDSVEFEHSVSALLTREALDYV